MTTSLTNTISSDRKIIHQENDKVKHTSLLNVGKYHEDLRGSKSKKTMALSF